MSANMFLQDLKPNPSQVSSGLSSTNENPKSSSDSAQKSSDSLKPSNQTHEQLQKKTNESRIPVPASPILLRRHNSLRLKGEIDGVKRFSGLNHFQTSMEEKSLKYRNGNISHTSAVTNQRGSVSSAARLQEFSAAGKPPLKRGQSFVERGEKCGGSRNNENRNHGGSVGGRVPNAAASLPLQPQRNGKRATGGVAGELSSPVRVRSLSLSLSNTRISSPKSPKVVTSSPNNLVSPVTRDNFSSGTIDCCWDTESVTSIGSSVTSCDHAAIARNGTTFSGRSMKYVFHCNQHSETTGDEYLTPTQRAHRQVKKLKYLLHQAKKDLEQKDSDILKLTREVVELRLYKAALNSSPEDKLQSNSSDAVTVKANTSESISSGGDQVDFLVHPQYNPSFTDSGHFEDGTNSSVHSKDSVFDDTRSPCKPKTIETSDKAVTAQIFSLYSYHHGSEQSKLMMDYEKRIQELIKTHEEETYHLKQKHNHKIEELLQRITEINSREGQLRLL